MSSVSACRKCGQKIGNTDLACPGCGWDGDLVACPFCGTSYNNWWQSCPVCKRSYASAENKNSAEYICEQCGASFDTSLDNCPKCGWEGERKRCAICGSLYHVWREKCPGCGGVNAERVAAPKAVQPEDHAFRASVMSTENKTSLLEKPLNYNQLKELENNLVAMFTELVRLEVYLAAIYVPEALDWCNSIRKFCFDCLTDTRSLQKEKNFSNIVKVGVIGEFSAGKSSFINSLLGIKICPTGDEATTSAVTRFSHIPDTFAIHRMSEGWDLGEEIEHGEYLRLARHGESGNESFYFACFLDAPELDGIYLYDTPGFSNSNSQKGMRDTELTEKILEKMDVIFYVADINDGSLGHNGLERLEPFREKETPVFLVLNKEDKKSPSARERILAQFKEEFEDFEDALSYSSTEEMEWLEDEADWDDAEGEAPLLLLASVQVDGKKRMALVFEEGMERNEENVVFLRERCDSAEGGYEWTLKSAPAQEGLSALSLSRIARARRSPKRERFFGWLEEIRASKEVFAQQEHLEYIGRLKKEIRELADFYAREAAENLQKIKKRVIQDWDGNEKEAKPWIELESEPWEKLCSQLTVVRESVEAL